MAGTQHSFNSAAHPQAQAYGQELLNALRKQMPDMDDVMWLIKNGASFDVTDGRGDTALHIAVRMGLEKHVSEMVLRGADVTAANEAGNTALIVAATGGESTLRALLAVKPDLSRRNNGGNDALTCAVAADKAANVKQLLAAGAKVDQKLLATAERLGRSEVLSLLQETHHRQREELGRSASVADNDVTVLKLPRVSRPKP